MEAFITPDIDLDELFFSFFVIMTDKINLKDLKALIKNFKAHECPRLGQRKEILLKFAQEHGLLKKKEVAPAVKEKKEVVEKQVVKEFKTNDGKKVKIVKKVKVPKNEIVKVEEPKKDEVVIEVKKDAENKKEVIREWKFAKVYEDDDLVKYKDKVYRAVDVSAGAEPDRFTNPGSNFDQRWEMVEKDEKGEWKMVEWKPAKKAEEPIKGRKEMSGAEMAQYDLAKQRRDKKALEHFHKAFPGLLESKKAEAPPMNPKDKNAARLKEVQRIRKEKGVSLKEAWAMLKN